nr:immunoglobulin light chain junction region [Macaca mulatta]MOY06077.1 immunoglobulin light chain junction region [Macaca mulatta]MOY06136.1 immunoglobulin light chain junction region [Macaca mulatta]MOY06344.1 immunoglobulin light chain junction region [Macaca mulatta]MOY07701.1 immunoglobulin light chain junction region [Macaca mulatta]
DYYCLVWNYGLSPWVF